MRISDWSSDVCSSDLYFALAYGIVFLLVGIAGFVPGLVTGPAPVTDAPAAEAESAGHLIGLFPVNPLHNAVHIVFGIWGLAAYRRSEERRGGQECVSRGRYRGSPSH